MKFYKRAMSMGLAALMAASLAACGGGGGGTESSSASKSSAGVSGTEAGGSGGSAAAASSEVPTIDKLNSEDYKDLKADIKILTDRTDIVDTTYKGYAQQFMELYPNITVTYEGITDYAESVTLRLTNGDWGDICFIPSTVEKQEFSNYFIPMGDYDTLNGIYNYVTEKTYDGIVYGIPNGGTAGGVAYNKRIWKEAGVEELPKTPDEFLADLKLIKDKTDAIPLYTNFSAGWTMGAWNDYVGIASNGDADYKNNKLLHQKDPFTKNDEMSGPYAVFYTLYEAVAQGLVEEDPASSDWESSKGMINRGEIATMVLGSWSVQQFKDAGDTPEDIGYMPFPISAGGVQSAAAGGNYAYGINNQASTDNQIAAMMYVKWLLEESPIYADEGSIPALKGKELPDSLSEFAGVELLSDNAPVAGEENLYDNIRNTAEVLSGDYPVCEVLEAALYGTKSLDDLMAEWNEQWTSAQETHGAEIRDAESVEMESTQ